MVYRATSDLEAQQPLLVWTPNFANDAEYWRHIAGAFEELTRTCLYCNFIAKHRGSLKRHITRKHSMMS